MSTEPGYELLHMDDITPVACPCGQTRRAFIEASQRRISFHQVDIDQTARVHYHKKHLEIYYILEGTGHLELNGKLVPVTPGTALLIHEGCRHRAVGQLKIVNVSLPAFDPEDEWFD